MKSLNLKRGDRFASLTRQLRQIGYGGDEGKEIVQRLLKDGVVQKIAIGLEPKSMAYEVASDFIISEKPVKKNKK